MGGGKLSHLHVNEALVGEDTSVTLLPNGPKEKKQETTSLTTQLLQTDLVRAFHQACMEGKEAAPSVASPDEVTTRIQTTSEKGQSLDRWVAHS